jgi:predicted peroxiredoxin/TusA-related sulfurtransferase
MEEREQMQTDTTLDRRGKSITTFVVHDLVRMLEGVEDGDRVAVLTDDFEPFRADIAAWCEATGHRLVAVEESSGALRFEIERGIPQERGTSLAVVLSSDGLEELLSPLGFALAAALEGMSVHLYLQGPAVKVVTARFSPKLRGWARPFTRFAAAGLAKAGHIPAREKLAQLLDLGAEIYLCGPSMQHFKVAPEDVVFEGLGVVEYLTFMRVMETADVQIYS